MVSVLVTVVGEGAFSLSLPLRHSRLVICVHDRADHFTASQIPGSRMLHKTASAPCMLPCPPWLTGSGQSAPPSPTPFWMGCEKAIGPIDGPID